MAGQHIRCSEPVQRKLKEIANREGVPMTKALEILVSTLPMEGKSEDERVLEEFFGAAPATKEEPAMAEYMSGVMARLEEITSQLDDFCGNFSRSDQAQQLNIAEAVRQAFEDQASLAQQFHQHRGDATCQGCIDVARHELSKTYRKAHQETVAYYEQIPGVKGLQKIYEKAKEEVGGAKARGEKTITIVG